MILLDSDTCIKIMHYDKKVIKQVKLNRNKIAISFMSIGELFYGAIKANYDNKIKLELVNTLLSTATIIHSDNQIMQKFGELKTNLYQRSMLVPDADILIAATALSKCSKLITGNIKHFDRFENLIIENWIR
jgi:predicted nucleic acid-binding protein